MCYYDPNKEYEIITDSGPAGISVILVQHSKTQEDHQIVAYSSRAINDVERRYSQMKRNASLSYTDVKGFVCMLLVHHLLYKQTTSH